MIADRAREGRICDRVVRQPKGDVVERSQARVGAKLYSLKSTIEIDPAMFRTSAVFAAGATVVLAVLVVLYGMYW